MTAKELITQYADTGIQLPEYQVNKLSNQDKKTYLRKRLLAVKDSETDEILSNYEINLLSKEEQDKYLLNLSDNKLSSYLYKSKDRDFDIDRLISINGFLDNLGDKGLFQLIQYYSEPNYIVTLVDNKQKSRASFLLYDLSYYDKRYLIAYSPTDPKKIKELLQKNGLNSWSKFIQTIINNPSKEFLNTEILFFIDNSVNTAQIIDLFLNDDYFISNLSVFHILKLLENAKNKDILIDQLLKNYERLKLLQNFNDDKKIMTDLLVRCLIEYSNDKNKVKNFLLNKGVSEDIINKY